MGLSPEQIALRRTRIGSSEIGALLGADAQGRPIDPYKSAHDVFLEKTLPQEDNAQPHQTWGLDLEPAILAHHARRSGYTLLPSVGSLTHPSLPLVCTPDALATADALLIDLQAKNDQGYGQIEWGDPGTDQAPLLYVAQVTVELGVLRAAGHDVSHGELAVSIRGAPPVAYRIDFDAEAFGQLAEVAAKFKRDHLDTGKPPQATAAEASEYIRRRFAKHTENMLEPTPELRAIVQEWRTLKESASALESDITAAENRLKEAIGDAAGIAGLVTWKTQKGSTYTVTKKPGRTLRQVKGQGA